MEGRLGRKIPDPKKLTAQEAMLWKAIQKGLAGDAKAIALAFKRYDDATASSWGGPVITAEEDQQVYDALRAKIRREIEEE
jgi:shikimate kinase